MRRVQWLSDIRVNVRTQCIPMFSRGGSRDCVASSVREVQFSVRVSRRVTLVSQSPDDTPQSIHNKASGSVSSSSSRPVQVTFGKFDSIAFNTGQDSDNSILQTHHHNESWNETFRGGVETRILLNWTDSLPEFVLPLLCRISRVWHAIVWMPEGRVEVDRLLPTMVSTERTLMRSQCGPLVSVPFISFPTCRSVPHRPSSSSPPSAIHSLLPV